MCKSRRESLVLSAEEWNYLQALAEKYNTCAPTGSKAGQPSWRTFIKALAQDEFEVKPLAPEAEL